MLRRRCGALVVVALLLASGLPIASSAASFAESYNRALQLNAQVDALYAAGRYREAIPLAQEQLAIAERLFGPVHKLTGASVANLAGLYRESGDDAAAAALFQRSVDISIAVLGAEHPDTAADLANLASVHEHLGAYLPAETAMQRALAIREKALGPRHPATAESLNQLANLYAATGQRPRAGELYRRALAIREQSLGERHLDTAESLNDLAGFLLDDGLPAQAEPLLKRSLAIQRRLLGAQHPQTVATEANLGVVYQATGAASESEALLRHALPLLDQQLGADHPNTVSVARQLARRYRDTGRLALAEPLLRRVLAQREKALGPDHPWTADALDDLASFELDRKVPAAARPLFERALAIRERTLGPQHRSTVFGISALAVLADAEGDHANAERLAQRAVALAEPAFGPNHPEFAAALRNLALLTWGGGDPAQAMTLLQRAQDIDDAGAAQAMVLGDEARKAAYAGTLRAATDLGLSLSLAARDTLPQTAAAFGLNLLLRRKGQVLDVMADSLAALRSRADPAERALVDRWQQAAARLAALSLAVPLRQPSARAASATAAPPDLAGLRAELAELEAEWTQRSAAWRSRGEAPSVARVRAALPKGAVLVEWARHRPLRPRAAPGEARSGPPRYAAFVLAADAGVEPVAVDLGDAESVDALVSDLLAAIRDRGPLVETLARELDARLLQPLRPHLGGGGPLLLSPDGALNRLPFGVLRDDAGRYLIERREIGYLTSGRDLLRPRPPVAGDRPALVIAAPDYGAIDSAPQPAAVGGRRSADFGAVLRFAPLPGTAAEATALMPLLAARRPQLLSGAQATESALRAVHGPAILHIATHGFFLPDAAESADDATRWRTTDSLPSAAVTENPLLRSGLALAGANARRSGDDDGIFTALELSGLDLAGTELAVLSACETGLGALRTGEGVYGLRRALVLAGVRSQVVSLWKVDDASTARVMVDYHRRLARGEGRSAALRAAQLTLRRSAATAHPYHWAAFVSIGDSGPLPPVAPGGARAKTRR